MAVNIVMIFSIEMSLSKVKCVNVEADSLAQAIEKAKDKNADWRIDAIDDKYILGYDEYTEEPIFEDDDYVEDGEGCMQLWKNIPVND